MHVSLIQVPRLPPAAPEHQMTLSNTKLKRWLSALWKDNMSQVTALACSHSCCHLYLNFHLNSKFTCFHCNNNNTYSCECSSHAYRWRLQGSCSQVKLPCRVVHSADMGQFSSFIILFDCAMIIKSYLILSKSPVWENTCQQAHASSSSCLRSWMLLALARMGANSLPVASVVTLLCQSITCSEIQCKMITS